MEWIYVNVAFHISFFLQKSLFIFKKVLKAIQKNKANP